jgi:hypothetical protein
MLEFFVNNSTSIINVREYRRGNNKMNNAEKLAKKKTKKNTTQYVLDTNMCKQTQSTDHLYFSQKQVQR